MSVEFDRERNLKFWKRCLRTVLPPAYTSMDSIRITLAFFIVSAFDLLTPTPSAQAFTPPTTDSGDLTDASSITITADSGSSDDASSSVLNPKERYLARKFVRQMQHPTGGFCGSPTHVGSCAFQGDDGHGLGYLHTPNLAATFFALMLLAAVASDDDDEDPSADDSYAAHNAFAFVDRRATLRFLKSLQRPDGSFAEVRVQDEVFGGRDMRYCYMATGIRWILGPWRESDGADGGDIDVEALVAHVRQAQTYDGGVGEDSLSESHAGYAFCALATLALLERPPDDSQTSLDVTEYGLAPEQLAKFLVHRQMVFTEGVRNMEEGNNSQGDEREEEVDKSPPFDQLYLESLGIPANLRETGFNGRENKYVDTCYTWWTGGALDILGYKDLIDTESARRFLLVETQGLLTGGFTKHPGGLPDIYHSYLGLAALGLLGRDRNHIAEFDTVLCASKATVGRIVASRATLLEDDERRAQVLAKATESVAPAASAARGVAAGETKPAPGATDDMRAALSKLILA